eukprot:scaffold2239_cov114-Skeletonema_dohrnii-CCMP3373.AAC.15
MRNYASAVRGENDHPNTLAKQSTKWTLVQQSKKKLSVSALMNVASKNVLRTSLHVIKNTTKSHQRPVPALQCNSSSNKTHYTGTGTRYKKPPLFRASKFGVSNNTLYSVDELKAMKRRFTHHDGSSHLHVLVLLSNLELDYAKLLQEACNSTGNMLRKTLQAIKYPDSYTVKLERSGKNVYALVLQLSRQLDRYHEMKLKDIYAKHKCEGFAKWLGGMTGWYYSPGVNEWGQFIIARLNDLQSVVKTYAPPELLYCFPGESKTLVWCKRQDLWRCVIDVRFFVERAKKKLPGTSSARRLKLLQNSDDGPDSLVHWAHHDPQNNYPLTVVTEVSMERLVELLVELLLQVLPHDAKEKLNGILATLFRKKKQ